MAGNHATGKVVEIGTDAEGQPRILIHCTEDDIKGTRPILYRRVKVVEIPEPETQPEYLNG